MVSIASDGTRMTYLRRHAIVIRDLKTHAERVVPVKDKLWRVEVDRAGYWAKVDVIRKDTDGDRKRDWPGGVGDGYVRSCDADLAHYRNPIGDDSQELWLDLVTGKLVEDSTVIEPLGDVLLRKRADGALVLGRTELVEASCNAVVGETLSSPPRVSVRCNDKGPAMIVGPGFRHQLKHDRYFAPWFLHRDHARFLHSETRVLDLVTGEEIDVPGKPVEQAEHLVLVETTTGYAVFDAIHRTTRPLKARGKVTDRYSSKWLVHIGGTIYDLRSGQDIRSNFPVYMADDRGRVLLGVGRKGARGMMSHGPLRWWP
jgi:hypothetical protein